MATLYSYRIMTDTGFSPCYDDGLFTLACCKPVIRRMVGRSYFIRQHSRNDPVWLVAIGGSSNLKRRDEWIFAAKITDAVTYCEYFSNPAFRKRRDCIYVIENSGQFNGYSHYNIRFHHNGTSPFHKTPHTWEVDWDKKEECFVLISDEFAYLTHAESNMLTAQFPQYMASGRGHRKYEGPEIQKLTDLLQRIANNGSKQFQHTDNLDILQKRQRTGC